MPRKEIVSVFSIAVATAAIGALSTGALEAQEPRNSTDSMANVVGDASIPTRTLSGLASELDVNVNPGSEASKPDDLNLGENADGSTMTAQVLLDRRGFSPGIIDGIKGKNYRNALRGFQEANGLKVNGRLTQETIDELNRDPRESTIRLRITRSVVDGNYVQPFPDDPEKQAELKSMSYRNLLEEVAERFHTTPEIIVALNGANTELGLGSVLRLPNVLPTDRNFGDLDTEHGEWFTLMNIEPGGPAKGTRIVVTKSENTLKVFDAQDNLVGQFPVTTGSERDPLPIGDWEVTTFSYLPPFNYQPDLFWDVDDSNAELMLPPGPNGPVGVAWLDLSKEHYGIHGTSEPATINYTQSHGCLRMTNWDVLTLSRMLSPGFDAEFVT